MASSLWREATLLFAVCVFEPACATKLSDVYEVVIIGPRDPAFCFSLSTLLKPMALQVLAWPGLQLPTLSLVLGSTI